MTKEQLFAPILTPPSLSPRGYPDYPHPPPPHPHPPPLWSCADTAHSKLVNACFCGELSVVLWRSGKSVRRRVRCCALLRIWIIYIQEYVLRIIMNTYCIPEYVLLIIRYLYCITEYVLRIIMYTYCTYTRICALDHNVLTLYCIPQYVL